MDFYCFQDTENIDPGDDLVNKIYEGIQTCKVFVPLVSCTYGSRFWTAIEVSYFRLNVHLCIFSFEMQYGTTIVNLFEVSVRILYESSSLY